VANIEVRVRCICPDPATHPEGDTVELPERLTFHQLAIATKSVLWLKSQRPSADVPEWLALLSEVYLEHCLAGWSLQAPGAKGRLEPVPLTPENVAIYLLTQPDVAFEVAAQADDLYSSAVLSPLLRMAESSSPAGPTGGSTSPKRANGLERPKRPKRSSISTSPTAGTGQMA
jgi:hypothetical protein